MPDSKVEGGATFRTRPGAEHRKGGWKGLIYFQKERESLGQLRFRNSFNRTITLCVSLFAAMGEEGKTAQEGHQNESKHFEDRFEEKGDRKKPLLLLLRHSLLGRGSTDPIKKKKKKKGKQSESPLTPSLRFDENHFHSRPSPRPAQQTHAPPPRPPSHPCIIYRNKTRHADCITTP
ncbi:hypothetical protein CEXT_244471 [Caerostris extrusa]|uniref:Uncharacterized protein n=1 Tax=Caerostris extrusa TaxID=172846 RepID=A0AAV4VJA2_CAEEX|nr:hypothetical protein CEXT_244471 [Caerostris extrusa]